MVPLFNGPSATFSSLKVKLNRCSLISRASCRWGSRGELSITRSEYRVGELHLTISSVFFFFLFFSKAKTLDKDS